MRQILYLILLLPLFVSCQEKYNKGSYDEKEKILRQFPIENSTRIVFDSLWQKRDSLTYLRLSNLELILMHETNSIPKWIGNFSKMKIFQIANKRKKVKTIPESIGRLSNLFEIDVSDNNISTLPDSLFNLMNLTYLRLDNNNISSLSSRIKNLKKIKFIYFSNNPLKKIPETICELNKLESLDLQNTMIVELPKCIDSMQSLEWIDVSGTQLTEFPVEILNAPKLKTIHANRLKLKNYEEIKTICEKRRITFYYDE